MKRLILIFFILIILITNPKGQWEILNESGSFRTIDFVNDQIGWIAGDGTLLKTEDGGETWKSFPQHENWRDPKIDFVSETIGWCVRSYWDKTENMNKNTIIKTLDGGQTWFIQKEFKNNSHSRFVSGTIYAVNDSNVYAVGDVILKTSDGGTSWVDVSPNMINRQLNSIWFFNNDTGIVSGRFNDGNTVNGILLRTIDGGMNWEEKNISDFDNISDLQFIDNTTGYFLAQKANYGGYFLCRTSNTLNSWSKRAELIHSYCFLNKNTVVAVKEYKYGTCVMKSAYPFFNWQKKLADISFKSKIYSNNSGAVYILDDVTTWTTIWKSFDMGENWISQNFGFQLEDVCFIDKNIGIAGGFVKNTHWNGGRSRIFFTQNGGKSWEIRFDNVFLDKGVFSSQLIDDLIGYAFYGNTVYKTYDSGINWINICQIEPETIDFPFSGGDIFFRNATSGWIAGSHDYGDGSGFAILKTVNGGHNWVFDWHYEKDGRLNSIHFVDKTGWAVGESGMIVKYTEEDQWKSIPEVTDLPLRKVFFSDEQHGWIAGGYFDEDNQHLILLITRDGGENWQEKAINYQINDMFFEDSLHGWAVGNDTSYINQYIPSNSGVLLETWDGGTKWKLQVEDLSAPLTAIHFKDGYLWAVGGNGLILKSDITTDIWIDEKNCKVYPTKYALNQNYPNPFNPSTTIEFNLPKASDVRIEVYNIAGQKIQTLINKRISAGSHQVEFNSENLSSGVYFYRIEAGNFHDVKKMVLLR
jgi:photosystem II stability/assembly factor-like uncharacterized protein